MLMRLSRQSLPTSSSAVLQEVLKRRIRGSYLDWCEWALAPAGQAPAAHHRHVGEKLQQIADGTHPTGRVMILMPPGSAKSTYGSVLYPPWLFNRFDNFNVIAASHTLNLAEQFSGKVQQKARDNADVLRFTILRQAVEQWNTDNGCEYKCAGVDSPIAGFRADLGIIDDPVKSRKAVESETQREAAWNWYTADFLTRLKPNARQVFIVTRWHEDDLAGRVLREHGDEWEVVAIPALAGEGDALSRAPGEPLWADDAYGYAADLEIKRAQLGERDWESLYQQNPTPKEGGVFKTGRIGTVEAIPAGTTWVRGWDFAATKETGTNDPSRTVGLKLGRTPAGRFVVGDVERMTGGPEEVEATFLATAQRDGRGVPISAPQDPGQAGKVQVSHLSRLLLGWEFVFTPESGDKATRAAAFASQVNVGNVDMLAASWNHRFIEELRAFPGGKHDDQVDAASRAFHYLTEQASIFDQFKAMAS